MSIRGLCEIIFKFSPGVHEKGSVLTGLRSYKLKKKIIVLNNSTYFSCQIELCKHPTMDNVKIIIKYHSQIGTGSLHVWTCVDLVQKKNTITKRMHEMLKVDVKSSYKKQLNNKLLFGNSTIIVNCKPMKRINSY